VFSMAQESSATILLLCCSAIFVCDPVPTIRTIYVFFHIWA